MLHADRGQAVVQGREVRDAAVGEIGEQAARMLLALMRGQAVARTSVDLGFELCLRDSA